MKIIQLIYALGPGGAEKFVVNLANSLSRLGNDVTVCIMLDDNKSTNSYLKPLLDKGVHFFSFKFNNGLFLSKIRKVCKFINAEKPDIVHCHLNVIPYIFPLALVNQKIKFIHTIHSLAHQSCGYKFQKKINKFFYKTKRIIPVTISTVCQQSFQDFYKIPNIFKVDNGCISPPTTTEYYKIRQEIKQLTEDENTKIFVHLARFSPPKNQKLLIEAFNFLNNKKIDFILLIIGNEFEKEEAQKLKELSCEKIHFLGAKTNVGDYLKLADAFCLSSAYEGLPISLIEAMSYGVVPICTAVGGIPDVIKDGETGYLCQTQEVSDYTQCILRYIENNLDSEKIKNVFNKLFSMDNCTKNYLEIYNLKL